MANKSQKGAGGKRGHSGQDNWMTHQEEKDLGRRLRRSEGRELEREGRTALPDEDDEHENDEK